MSGQIIDASIVAAPKQRNTDGEAFGYKNHLGINRRHRLIRRWTVTAAAATTGRCCPN